MFFYYSLYAKIHNFSKKKAFVYICLKIITIKTDELDGI